MIADLAPLLLPVAGVLRLPPDPRLAPGPEPAARLAHRPEVLPLETDDVAMFLLA